MRFQTENSYTGGCSIETRLVIRLAQIILGWLFLILGIIGLFLPLLQGVLFITIGLTLLSTRYAFARSLLEKARNRYPAEYARMQEIHDRIVYNKILVTIASIVLLGLLALGIYLAALGYERLTTTG
jgi:uncharacterized membrane protein YbaN (DUF454 family)